MKRLSTVGLLFILLGLCLVLCSCAQSSIEFNPSTGLLKITDPKDTKLAKLKVSADGKGGFTLDLAGLDANASNPASVQVLGIQAAAEGAAKGAAAGLNPIK